MSTIEMKRNAFRVLATLALAAAPAFASPIFVDNFSFESVTPPGLTLHSGTCTAPCVNSSDLAIPGWSALVSGFGQVQANGNTGVFNAPWATALPDGTITNADSNGTTIFQQVGATVQAGWVYTLTVDMGHRVGRGWPGTFDLLINGNQYGPTSLVDPGDGNWGTYTATYTGTSLDAGQAITIQLRSSGIQAEFDNVRLDAAPEPASFLLIGPALLFLGLHKRRTVRS